MSLVDDLKRFDDKGCESCGAFRPDCWVPRNDDSDGAHALCWVCAHAVLAHDMAIGALVPDCDCSHTEIFPHDVLARRKRLAEIFDTVEDRSKDRRAAQPVAVPATPEPEQGSTFTTYSPSYNERGKRDPEGPVLVQTFRHVSPARIELVAATVRPRVQRVARTIAKRPRTVG